MLLPSEGAQAKALPSPEEQDFLLHLMSVYDSVRGEGAQASTEGYVSSSGHRVVGSLAGAQVRTYWKCIGAPPVFLAVVERGV